MRMPKWFSEYLETLPDYRVDELIAWINSEAANPYETVEEFLDKLIKINE